MRYREAFNNPKFRGPDNNGWQRRHQSAVATPDRTERPIVALLASWAEYADQHRAAYDTGIGSDGVLGPAWADLGANIRRLLNGSLGRLDGGTLDSFICNTLEAEGFNPDML